MNDAKLEDKASRNGKRICSIEKASNALYAILLFLPKYSIALQSLFV